ncbi:phage tail protein [Vibrio cyclitrophicus]|uniref:phage tail-collar fiber domain-containing protein n=2 Tax=Vibrio TaxID=662 RepID=UPI000CBB1087|nr:phage tail protein [Vibrio cyclitrophicus]PME51333.1 hypothetical protein BCV35_06215 [Vibrio cyclitrophicus]
MANVSDKSILTAAGKALLAQLNAEEKALVIDKMIFANVPNRPEYPQPDDVVPTDNVVHQAAVEQRGRLSEDSVIYSTTLASNEGPFEFNWTGAYCSEYGVLVTIDHHSLTPKTVDEPGVSGNTLVRSVVLEYKDIAEITNITVDASTWQYNATPRMKKMDNDVAQANIDQNGKDWFIEEGFLVTPQASAFSIKAGAGYVSGNRVALEFDRSIQVPNKPSFIYIDAHREGTPTGEQVTLFNFVVSAEEKDDYIDSSTGKDVPHFVCKIAQVLGDGSVSDLRPEGESAGKNWSKREMLALSENVKKPVLMSYYNLPQMNGGEVGLRLALSNDGINWNAISSSAISSVNVTTPSIRYSQSFWWVVGDTPNLGFSLYRSKDLVEWELVDDDIVPDGIESNFYDIWDADFFESAEGELCISFSVNHSSSNDAVDSLFYPYFAKVKDIHKAELYPAVKISSQDLDETKSYIDANITHFNGQYVMAIKSERIGDRAIFTLTASELNGVWSNPVDVVRSELPIHEGPSLIVNGGKLWIYYDRITGSNTTDKSYLYRVSDDGVAWSDAANINIDVTNLRHAYCYVVPDGAPINSIVAAKAMFERPVASPEMSLPKSALFAVGSSLTDVVSGLRPTGYSNILAKGSGVFDDDKKVAGQVLPPGYYQNVSQEMWNGKGSSNLISEFNHQSVNNRVTVDRNGDYFQVTVNEVTNHQGVYWSATLSANDVSTFSFISDRDISNNIVVINVNDGSVVAVTNRESVPFGGVYHHSVTFTAPESGDFRAGINTVGLSVADNINVKNIMYELCPYPTPYLNYGVVRKDSVVVYESAALDVRGKYVMCKFSSNFADNNDFIIHGSIRPDGKHTRLRPEGLDYKNCNNVFAFAVFGDDYELDYGYWSCGDDSGRLVNKPYYDDTLPDDVEFIQLGKPGANSVRRSYEYVIVGDFINSEFCSQGDVIQQVVKSYEQTRVLMRPAEEIAPVPFSLVMRREDGSVSEPLHPQKSITSSGTVKPLAYDVLTVPSGTGSHSWSFDGSSLNNGDHFYVLLASNSDLDSLIIMQDENVVLPGGVDMQISKAQLNNDSGIKFMKFPTGKIRRVM